MRNIPKHTAKAAAMKLPYSERGLEEYVGKYLMQFVDRVFINKNFGKVKLLKKSIDETAHNVRYHRKSAELALYLPYIIRNAKVIEYPLPVESKTQVNKFGFKDIAVMLCNVKNVGIAKLTVGFALIDGCVEYSITDFQKTKTSQFID